MPDDLSVFSLNVRGIRSPNKRKQLFQFLRRQKFDVVCLQETYITKQVADVWKKEWGGDMIYTERTSHSGGQMILFKKGCNFDYKVMETHCDRIQGVNIICEGKDLWILNAYAPNDVNSKCVFYQKVVSIIKDSRLSNVILCGDFNCVLDNELDIVSGERHAERAVSQLNEMFIACDLFDVWRLFNPGIKEFSWSKKNPFIARRIDYVFTCATLFDRTTECCLLSVPFSDHRGCSVQLKLSEIDRGPSYWKFNNSLLQDKDFIDGMNRMIENHAYDFINDTDYQTVWELLKCEIRDYAMQYAQKKSVERRNGIVLLYAELNDLDARLANDPDNCGMQCERENLKLKIELVEQCKARAAQVRARAKWVEQGEKNTKYFLNLEKARANAKIMDSIQCESGEVITDQREILNAQKNYYADLYRKKVNVENMDEKVDQFLSDVTTLQISDFQRNECEGLITENEALAALKQMKSGSAPGVDGITVEFLKVFWTRIRTLLIASFNASFDDGKLSSTQRKAVITLIHKGKDLPKNELKNWRPISLTNSDYKLIAKCLAKRLGSVIGDIVQKDQVGYIKGRKVSTILRLIDDVIEQSHELNQPGLLVAIDCVQAYDSISKEFIIKAFQKFGFGPEFVQWVTVLMNDTVSSVQYCGWLSDFFDVKAGIRQGCPFSCLAFVLAIELLASKIRQCRRIKGISLWNNVDIATVIKIALYADDITLFLKDEIDMYYALEIMNDFSSFSGLRIHKRKSEAMWLGSRKHCDETFYNFVWKKKLKILGVYFCNDKSASLVEDNWTGRIRNIKRLICAWEKRNLSIVGKICIVKTFLISQFVYIMQAFVLPDCVLNEVNTLLFRFLWRKRDCNRKAFEKVKRSVLCFEIEKGGLKMIDIRQMQISFLLQWVSQLTTSNENDNWSFTPKMMYLRFGKHFECFLSNVNSARFKGLDLVKSHFWKAVLKYWLDNNHYDRGTIGPILLWNNACITYSGKVLFFESWIQRGVLVLTDIVRSGDILSYQDICDLIGYSPNRILEYNVVKAAVSLFMRKNVVNMTDDVCITLPLFNGKNVLSAREYRKEIINMKTDVPCSGGFWKRKFNVEIDERSWIVAYQSTQETRLRVLHWKIMHNIYPTNILLCKMKVTETNKCNYCCDVTDFIEHFFFECPVVYKFWKFIEEFIFRTLEIKIVLKVSDVLFGMHFVMVKKATMYKLNHIILIGKMCVSIYKKTNSFLPLESIFNRQLQIRSIFV